MSCAGSRVVSLVTLAQPSCPNRVALFYLLDSIVKNAKKRDAPEYLNLVVQDLQDIVRQALGIRTSIRHPDGAVFNQMKPIVVKVLALWHQRGVISDQAHQQVLDLITYASKRDARVLSRDSYA